MRLGRLCEIGFSSSSGYGTVSAGARHRGHTEVFQFVEPAVKQSLRFLESGITRSGLEVAATGRISGTSLLGTFGL
jgi:hypothetical protein